MSPGQTKPPIRTLLEQRAHFFERVRSFFFKKNVLEVDTPVLVSFPPNDANIRIMKVSTSIGDRYLTSSPEYLMKRLLSEGSGNIFQLSHVYRDEPSSTIHSPFFMMLEWYRLSYDLAQLEKEVLELIQEVGIERNIHRKSYRDRFEEATGLDPLYVEKSRLLSLLQNHVHQPDSLSFEELIDAAFVLFVEPTMKKDIHVISTFLPHQAALAKIRGDEALRFEIYVDGVEIANGYEELSDPIEIQKRFDLWNRQHKTPLNVDPRFLDALPSLPPVSGVAVGADRLFMLQQKKETISSILPFDFSAS
jgi:lysyl-tRNA synthetase class 2